MPPTPSSDSRPARSGVVDDEFAADSMPSMRSPLPAGYFGDVQVNETKRQEYREIVRCRVNSMLADEHRYAERRAQQQPLVQETEWKFFRRIGGLKVYQRRFRGRTKQEVAVEEDFPEAAIAVERGNPSMLADGSVAGTIEDMLYGWSATTQEEMITGLSYTAPPQDAVLLNVVERSTLEDPLYSTELLWVLTKLPILNPRDVCFLKATGVGVDGRGRPYGYLVLHSVDIPECPPFDYRKTKVLRAKMFFSFLLREVTPGYVDVMGRGVFDLAGGELLKLVLPHATTSVMDGLLRGVGCAEAKKLTLLALRNRDERRQAKVISKQSVCSMCIRGKKGMLSTVRLRSCDVCGVPICKSCRVKDKRMFVGSRQPSCDVVCCQTCAQQARCITGVRLGEPEFVVVAEYYRKKRPSASSPSSSGFSAAAPTLSTPSLRAFDRRTNLDAVVGNEDDEKPEPKSLVSDGGIAHSSVEMTNSTLDDSCAGFDFDVSYSGTLSDLNSGEFQVDSYTYAKPYDELEEEPEPGHGVSAELLKEYAELGHTPQSTTSSGVRAWNENYQVKTDATAHDFGVNTSSFKRRPNSMLEWMMELQSSAEEAYITAKANEEIMKRSMR
ncbi:hypothetical protein PRIC1_008314 [Phytophthora ramorum]